MTAKKNDEVALTVDGTARLLGWQGSGTRTSPCYDSVLKACQRGELKARQHRGRRKSQWRILPSDARAWWNGATA